MPTNPFRKGNKKGAKINYEIAEQIRAEFARGATQGYLCRKYEISIGQIGRITRGEVWNRPEGEEANSSSPERPPLDLDSSLAKVLEMTGLAEPKKPQE